jgi:hypothetical protein
MPVIWIRAQYTDPRIRIRLSLKMSRIGKTFLLKFIHHTQQVVLPSFRRSFV